MKTKLKKWWKKQKKIYELKQKIKLEKKAEKISNEIEKICGEEGFDINIIMNLLKETGKRDPNFAHYLARRPLDAIAMAEGITQIKK